jgi:antirestriction protein ArdC
MIEFFAQTGSDGFRFHPVSVDEPLNVHPTRLNRDLGRKEWGDKGYAREELATELASAFLGRRSGTYAGSLRRSC